MKTVRYVFPILLFAGALLLVHLIGVAVGKSFSLHVDEVLAARPPAAEEGWVTQPAPALPPAASDIPKARIWVASPMTGPVKEPPVANFGVIESRKLYRSAQPSEAELRWLQEHGFNSVVSFRRETGHDTELHAAAGFTNYLWLDIEDETAPTDAQGIQFLDFVTDPQNWPVLIHCKMGLGRTGAMAALVRYAVDGWSMDQALEEARLYRGGVDLVQPQVDWLVRWAQIHPPGSYVPDVPSSSH